LSDQSVKKGFAGLSSLASDVEAEVPTKSRASEAEASPPARQHEEKTVSRVEDEDARASSVTPRDVPPEGNRRKPPDSPNSGKPTSGVGFFLSICVIVGVVALISLGQDDTRNSSGQTTYSQPSRSGVDRASDWGSASRQLTDPSKERQASTPTPPPTTTGPEFAKPPVGTNQVLSVAQIRWCLRQEMRIDIERPYVGTDAEVRSFNSMVADYNQRCGSYQYRVGALEHARRDVEGMRYDIASDAARPRTRGTATPDPGSSAHVVSNSRSRRPTSSGGTASDQGRAPTPSAEPKAVPDNGQMELKDVQRIQTLLRGLGYAPGASDGVVGPRTKAAIQRYQADEGLQVTGEPTSTLLSGLERKRARSPVPARRRSVENSDDQAIRPRDASGLQTCSYVDASGRIQSVTTGTRWTCEEMIEAMRRR
jgi:hypothetical protein